MCGRSVCVKHITLFFSPANTLLYCLLSFPDALWIVVEVQEDSSVLGLAEQLSSITTQDRMDIMERTDAHLSPLPPCAPHPSPSSMQGELYQPDSEFSSLRTDSDQQYFGNS